MKRVLPALAVIGFCAASTMASSTPIDINYNIAGVGGYTSDPATPTYGWSYPHAGMGTATVTSTSADLATDPTNAEVGALYLDTGLNVTAPSVTLNFDIDVLSQADSGYGQTKTVGGNDTPILAGVRIYGGGAWATSFQLAPTSTTGGLFGFRDANNASLTTLGTYSTNTTYHVQLDVDYTTGTADAYINNNLAISNYALWGGATPGATTSEIFVYLNGTTNGTSNEIALSETAVVPLPSAAGMGLGLLGLAGLGQFLLRRKLVA